MAVVIGIIGSILYAVLLIYMLVLIARLIFEWIPVFNRAWRPRGGMLVIAEAVYTVTDPPIRFFRRIIPPLRVGNIGIDFGFAITMFLVFIALSVARSLAT